MTLESAATGISVETSSLGDTVGEDTSNDRGDDASDRVDGSEHTGVSSSLFGWCEEGKVSVSILVSQL